MTDYEFNEIKSLLERICNNLIAIAWFTFLLMIMECQS